MKVGQFLNKAGHTVAKNSPLILTVAGVVGLGSTAVLAYKSAKKIEVITEKVEEAREQEERLDQLTVLEEMDRLDADTQFELDDLRETFEPVSRPEVAKDIAGAIALPVITGIASIACIALSYRVLTNRNNLLATALGAAVAEHRYYKERVREIVSEEEYDRLEVPVERTKMTKVNKNGKETEVDVDAQVNRRSLVGEWFDNSSEYTVDDHSYNLMFIESARSKLEGKLFRKGYIRLNEVFDELGFGRTRMGESFGWNTGDSFDLDVKITNVMVTDQGEQFVRPEIYIAWPTPKPIYNDVDYEGRYA